MQSYIVTFYRLRQKQLSIPLGPGLSTHGGKGVNSCVRGITPRVEDRTLVGENEVE